MNLSPKKNLTAMSPAKRNLRIKIEKRRATENRLLIEFSRPKIVIGEFTDAPKPSSYYVEVAKQRYRSLQESKSSQAALSSSSKISLSTSRSRHSSKRKTVLNPCLQQPVEDIIPNWLQARADFQESVKKMNSDKSSKIPFILSQEYHNRSTEDKDLLRNYLKTVKFFERLPQQVIIDTSNRLKKEEFNENAFIVRKGEDADSLIIIYEGIGKVMINGQTVAYKRPGEVIGDTTMDYRMPRSADVVASTKCIVFKLMREDYEAAVLHTKRTEKQENYEFLLALPIFQSWKQIKLLRLGSMLNIKQYESDSVIFKRGESSFSMFFIKQGIVNIFAYVSLEQSNQWPVSVNQWRIRRVNKEYLVKIAKLKTGQFFGEMELLQNSHRTMKAVTKTDCVLLELNKEHIVENFTEKDLACMKSEGSTPNLDIASLRRKLCDKIDSKVSTEKALLDALNADFTSLRGRNSILDPKLKRLSSWLASYRKRRTRSSKSLAQKVTHENSKNISISTLKKKRPYI